MSSYTSYLARVPNPCHSWGIMTLVFRTIGIHVKETTIYMQQIEENPLITSMMPLCNIEKLQLLARSPDQVSLQ